MQWENSTSWAELGAGRCPPCNAVWAAPKYARQYWPGPELPCPPLFVPLNPPGMAGSQGIEITLWTSMLGSPWLGSPWLRMQAAHSSSSSAGSFANVVGEFPLPLPLLVLGSVVGFPFGSVV